MGALLFSPNGDISPAQFLRGAYVLILLTILVNTFPIITVMGAVFIKYVFFPIVFYCWSILFIKRYRRGGKSGWMTLLPIGIFLFGFMILSVLVQTLFGGEMYAEYQAAMVELSEDGLDLKAMMGLVETYAEPLAKKLALPWAFAYAAFSAGLIWLFNAVIPDTATHPTTFE